MARYIDKENIDKKIEDIISRQPKDFSSYQNGFYTAIKYLWGEISDLPTADVVAVVKCKDCKYSRKQDKVFGITDYKCVKHNISCLSPYDFCSYGERRTDNDL